MVNDCLKSQPKAATVNCDLGNIMLRYRWQVADSTTNLTDDALR